MPRPERLELLRTNPLIEITLLHRAMRLELEAMCEATRALAAAPANDGAALAALRRRFRAFDAVFASHSAAEDDVVFPALAACAGRDVASHAAAEHIDEVALVDGAAAALDAAAARGRCDGATVAALQDLKEKLADHMDHEEGEIFPLLAEIPERELKRMAGLVLGARPADVLELTIRLQVQHLEPALARHVLGTMCEVARGTRFRRWLDRALGAAAGAPAAGLSDHGSSDCSHETAEDAMAGAADAALTAAAARRCGEPRIEPATPASVGDVGSGGVSSSSSVSGAAADAAAAGAAGFAPSSGEGRGADIEPITSPICGTAAAAAASRSGDTIGDARFEFALDSARLGAFDGGFDGAALPGRDVFFFLSASRTSASSSAEISGHVASAATDGGCTSPPA